MDASQPPSDAGDDSVEALIAERDLWHRRATDCEQRWDAFLALEAERAELRRQASETLDRDRLNLVAERDDWQRRATVAESRLAELSLEAAPADASSSDDARFDALAAERDAWRERAVRAESSKPADNDKGSSTDNEDESPSRRQRFRGNWLG